MGALEAQIKSLEDAQRVVGGVAVDQKEEESVVKDTTMTSKRNKDSRLPADDGGASNPYADVAFPRTKAEAFQLQKSFKGHTHAVSFVAHHPKKAIVATASDDMTWKLWAANTGELVMSGQGHSSWLSCVAFSPSGAHLVTTGGDNLVKVWSFETASCVATFADHPSCVWGAAYHHAGDFVVSCRYAGGQFLFFPLVYLLFALPSYSLRVG